MYTGTPGSGKSYHAAKVIHDKLRRGKNVISTMAVDMNVVNKRGSKKTGIYEYFYIDELTPKYLIEFAMQHHRKGKEGQTVIVIDECQIIFNSRDYGDKGRKEWLIFFSVHRHYGYDFILITQQYRNLDRQIRGLAEIEYRHRKINNRGMLNLLPVKIFAVIEYWRSGDKEVRVGAHFVRFKRAISRMYNSYEASNLIAQKLGVDTQWDGNTHAAPAPPVAQMGGGGSPSERRRSRVLDWMTDNLRTATVKY
jgi:zona occludens toxin (predicted ATPase)